jgi:hypothetical protein
MPDPPEMSLSSQPIRWVKDWMAAEGEITVWVDVGKLDAAWWQARPNYYVRRGNTLHVKPGSYENAGKRITSGYEIGMSILGLGVDGQITFIDGRHRFAWVRDHGILAIPILVEEREVSFFGERYGTPLRRSDLPLPVRRIG